MGLKRQLSECDHIFSDDLKQATWDTQVDVAPPPAYKIMLVKRLGHTTVRKAVEVRDFLSENIMLKGQRGILHLAGLANDSLVFYVSEGNVGPMLQRMQYKRDQMLAEGLVQVTFVNLVRLEVQSGHITPYPNVSVRTCTHHPSSKLAAWSRVAQTATYVPPPFLYADVIGLGGQHIKMEGR